jgi:hypothetical protein
LEQKGYRINKSSFIIRDRSHGSRKKPRHTIFQLRYPHHTTATRLRHTWASSTRLRHTTYFYPHCWIGKTQHRNNSLDHLRSGYSLLQHTSLSCQCNWRGSL